LQHCLVLYFDTKAKFLDQFVVDYESDAFTFDQTAGNQNQNALSDMPVCMLHTFSAMGEKGSLLESGDYQSATLESGISDYLFAVTQFFC